MINYYLITKPGIILGNLMTVAAGFFLASKGKHDFALLFETLIGLGFIIASACVFNNYIDRHIDKQMTRTKNRPLVTGLISGKNAILFGSLLGILGTIILAIFTNLLTVAVASVGFFVYVVLYSLWKRHTIYGTAIGSIAGAVPPVVGYCAVSDRMDLGALIFFSMMVLWQMPHFYAIAMAHFKDYSAANIPVLPVKKGVLRTKIHMILYIVAFLLAAGLLTYFQYTGIVYLYMTIGLGVAWALLSLSGFISDNEQLWGRRMFYVSLVVIGAICLMIPFDTI